jgi:large subunit ribosomal protein L21|tara:strand:+ start:1024 stop:1446 length:423 start_codon:yes stop_codon:yes gene_type:complete
MSFAIFKTGGKQYKVQASEILKIEKLELSKDNKIEFNEILAYGDKKNVELGFPLIKGAKIEAELIKNSKERTVLVFKKRRRKNSRKKYGHRQPFTLIRINKIFSKDGKILASAEKKTEKTLKVIKEGEKKKTIIKKKVII